MVREIIWRRLHAIYIDVPALRPGTVGAYALAIVSVGVATALRVVLDPYLEGAQFVTFYPAVVITTLVSGLGAGFLSAVLSTAVADFFLLSPRWDFRLEHPAAAVDLLLFGPLAAYVVMFEPQQDFDLHIALEVDPPVLVPIAISATGPVSSSRASQQLHCGCKLITRGTSHKPMPL